MKILQIFILIILTLVVSNIADASDSIKVVNETFDKIIVEKNRKIEELENKLKDTTNSRIETFRKIINIRDSRIKFLEEELRKKRYDESREYFNYIKNRYIPIYDTIFRKLGNKIVFDQKIINIQKPDSFIYLQNVKNIQKPDSIIYSQEIKFIQKPDSIVYKKNVVNKDTTIINLVEVPKDSMVYKINIVKKDSVVYERNIVYKKADPEVVSISGIEEAEAQKIKSQVDSVEINEDDKLSKAEKDKIIFNLKKDAESKYFTVTSTFPDEKKEIVCLLVWEVSATGKKLLAIFNNGGGVKIPYTPNMGDIKVCSYVKGKKKQKFAYSKKVL